MRAFFIRVWVSLFFVWFLGCSRAVYVPSERRIVEYQTVHDTVIATKIEKEIVQVSAPDTVIQAETQYARAEARRRNNELSLRLENKDTVIPVKTKYLVTTIRDSVPYAVEVVREKVVYKVRWYDRILRGIGLIALLGLVGTILLRRG